jgi:hypothetical protein
MNSITLKKILFEINKQLQKRLLQNVFCAEADNVPTLERKLLGYRFALRFFVSDFFVLILMAFFLGDLTTSVLLVSCKVYLDITILSASSQLSRSRPSIPPLFSYNSYAKLAISAFKFIFTTSIFSLLSAISFPENLDFSSSL